MKHVFLSLLLAALFSCNHQQPAQTPVADNTPKVLQEEASETSRGILFKSYERNDLLEELFKELTDTKPEYKALLNDIKVVGEMERDSLRKFRAYQAKSDSYYQSANRGAANIHDTLLRAEVKRLLLRSEKTYEHKIAATLKMTEEVETNQRQYLDLLNVLKITSTLRLVETYQNKALDNAAIKKILDLQKEVIQRLQTENRRNGFGK